MRAKIPAPVVVIFVLLGLGLLSNFVPLLRGGGIDWFGVVVDVVVIGLMVRGNPAVAGLLRFFAGVSLVLALVAIIVLLVRSASPWAVALVGLHALAAGLMLWAFGREDVRRWMFRRNMNI